MTQNWPKMAENDQKWPPKVIMTRLKNNFAQNGTKLAKNG
jgi:hypothetical protein